jgi:hypothetical protein
MSAEKAGTVRNPQKRGGGAQDRYGDLTPLLQSVILPALLRKPTSKPICFFETFDIYTLRSIILRKNTEYCPSCSRFHRPFIMRLAYFRLPMSAAFLSSPSHPYIPTSARTLSFSLPCHRPVFAHSSLRLSRPSVPFSTTSFHRVKKLSNTLSLNSNTL